MAETRPNPDLVDKVAQLDRELADLRSTAHGRFLPFAQRGHPAGLTGATAATRYVGGTASGAPTSGTFAVGDFVIDQSGMVWICTVAGTPGTWHCPSGPFGHTGRTAGFQDNSTGSYVDFTAAQELRGGMTFSAANNSLTVPFAGRYRISGNGYFTGSSGYLGITYLVLNSTGDPPAGSAQLGNALCSKPDANDHSGFVSVVHTLAANDVIRLYTSGLGDTWGTDGYNGSWLEVEYIGA